MITIESSWGVVTTDDEGNVDELDVLEVDDKGERCYLLDIAKFDIAEWDGFYEDRFKEPSPKPSDFEVLVLGYWLKNGEYVEPNQKWRDEMYHEK